MAYTVRYTIRVRGTRRILKSFIRSEYALNTSSHADRFNSIDAAEHAADTMAERASGAGHTYIGADFFRVED